MRPAPHTIRDRIAFATSADSVRDPAVAVIDALDRFDPAVQIEAAFAAAVILARTVNLDPHELVARARRQVVDLEAHETSVSAISDYAKGELK